jgi:hypothetical protein
MLSLYFLSPSPVLPVEIMALQQRQQQQEQQQEQ